MFSDPQSIINQAGISHGHSVADFGSGSGFYSLASAKAVGSEGRVYAIDVQKDLLEKLKAHAGDARLKNLEVIWGDIEKINGTHLKDGLVDFVIIANVLFQTSDKNNLAMEASRVLRHGGKIVLVDWSDSFGGMGPHKDHIISESAARSIFENAGFSFIKNINAGEHHFGMVFRKM